MTTVNDDIDFFDPDNVFNGSIFVIHAEGENYDRPEEDLRLVTTYVPNADSVQQNTKRFTFDRVTMEKDFFMEMVVINYHNMKAVGTQMTNEQMFRVAYLRSVSVLFGLVSPSYVPTDNHVHYNGCIVADIDDFFDDAEPETEEKSVKVTQKKVDVTSEGDIVEEKTQTATRRGKGEREVSLKMTQLNLSKVEVRKFMTKKMQNFLNGVFNDLVCLTAYIFRTRGHHYLDGFDSILDRVWERALHKKSDLGLEWVHVTRYAFHAIMPNVLDAFWEHCVQGSFCSGTFIVRFNCASAGTAAIHVTSRGVNDIKLLFPGLLKHLEAEVEHLDAMVDELKHSRWKGSINSTFYGLNRDRFSEQDLGALGAVVTGIYRNLAPQEDLLGSKALERIARYAPVTGNMLGQAAVRVTRNEKFVGSLVDSIKE